MHHHPPLSLVHFAIHQSIGHHPVSYNARRMDEAQPRWLGLLRELCTDQISCLPATEHRGTTQGFPSRVHHGIPFDHTATLWSPQRGKEPYFTSAPFHTQRCPIIPLSAPTKYQYLQLILAGIRLYINPVFHILINRFATFIFLLLLLSKSF